jgi:predicted dehydrogenase
MFRAEMEHFLTVMRGEALPLCTLEDGIQALQLAIAAHKSDATKKIVRL